MNKGERLKLIQEAIDEHRKEVKAAAKEFVDKSSQAGLLGATHLDNKRVQRILDSYKKFFNSVVNAMEMP